MSWPNAGRSGSSRHRNTPAGTARSTSTTSPRPTKAATSTSSKQASQHPNPKSTDERGTAMPEQRHRVVIVGGGFGGLNVARTLADADVDVTLVDRTNHHLFQPLLYQVAAGILPPGLIAPALRSVIKAERNARALLADVYDL